MCVRSQRMNSSLNSSGKTDKLHDVVRVIVEVVSVGGAAAAAATLYVLLIMWLKLPTV